MSKWGGADGSEKKRTKIAAVVAAITEWLKTNPHCRFKLKPTPEPEDLKAEYTEALTALGYSDKQIARYMRKIDCALLMYESMQEDQDALVILTEMLKSIRTRYATRERKKRERNEEDAIFPAEVVILVKLLATISGHTSNEDVADYWFENNIYLRLIIPNMPGPKHMISASTIELVLKLMPKGGFEELLNEYFSDVKIAAEELILNSERGEREDCHRFKRTIGGDGQEVRASFRPGNNNRMAKCGSGITLFDCDAVAAIACTTEKLKNHEDKAFIRMLDKLDVAAEDILFYADAINTKDSFIEDLNNRGINWLLPVKKNGGHKWLKLSIDEVMISHPRIKGYTKTIPLDPAHGRQEVYKIKLLPVSVLPVVLDIPQGTKTLMQVEKITEFPRKNVPQSQWKEPTHSVIAYISSLEFTPETMDQLLHSRSVRWWYEQHHHTLDTVLMQDKQQICDERALDALIGLNKCAYNVLSFARQQITKQEGIGAVRVTRHRETTTATRPVSYRRVVNALDEDPFVAWQYLLDYFMAGSAENAAQSPPD